MGMVERDAILEEDCCSPALSLWLDLELIDGCSVFRTGFPEC